MTRKPANGTNIITPSIAPTIAAAIVLAANPELDRVLDSVLSGEATGDTGVLLLNIFAVAVRVKPPLVVT